MLVDVPGLSRVKSYKQPQWKFKFVLAIGALIAAVLCSQCVRTYLYIGAVLIPQQAEREAQREAGRSNRSSAQCRNS